MIKSIHYENFKALRSATLPLSRFTLIVGPNGSGKSTAMEAVSRSYTPSHTHFWDVVAVDQQDAQSLTVSVAIEWALDDSSLPPRRGTTNGRIAKPAPSLLTVLLKTSWVKKGNQFIGGETRLESDFRLEGDLEQEIRETLKNFRIFSFNPRSMTQPVLMRRGIQLEPDGQNLAGVLENLRDNDERRFEELNEELKHWLPEFNRVLFDTPNDGQKSFVLRTRGGHKIRAENLSQGTLLALGFLTVAYLPNPPSIVCFEEPDRGIHPRLLRDIRDSMYRLSYPEQYGDKRRPVQVIATTHSPYLLDLYKDYPEEVVIAHKDQEGAHFERLSDNADFSDLLKDAQLGEIWYSGVLGGVPLEQ